MCKSERRGGESERRGSESERTGSQKADGQQDRKGTDRQTDRERIRSQRIDSEDERLNGEKDSQITDRKSECALRGTESARTHCKTEDGDYQKAHKHIYKATGLTMSS